GDKVLAVTAVSATYPSSELILARKTAGKLGARHRVIKTNEFADKKFTANPVNRCYYCKNELFKKLKKIARREKLRFVIDASNFSDRKDFRPGARAKTELGIRSPLEEAGFTKQDIRRESRVLGLSTWDKPAQACLASRVPYGTKLLPEALARINKAEDYLKRIGFKQSRLRHHNGFCRIEVLKKDIPQLIRKRNLLVGKLKKLGYNYITVDLEGYRTGSMNEVIK
ncbi:MAG: ATP-dependent sacrificial sulfur transferase LarE, partial [Candidatus Omnitrophica bacterium]|nr:ATP-dependent sacrificial sulfur transferase LarE [Candidatus Omnitrophota bacterium]